MRIALLFLTWPVAVAVWVTWLSVTRTTGTSPGLYTASIVLACVLVALHFWNETEFPPDD